MGTCLLAVAVHCVAACAWVDASHWADGAGLVDDLAGELVALEGASCKRQIGIVEREKGGQRRRYDLM